MKKPIDFLKQHLPGLFMGWKTLFKNLFYPFGTLDKKTKTFIFIVELALLFAWLEFFRNPLFPKPSEVVEQIFAYLQDVKFYDNLLATLGFLGTSLLYGITLTLIFSCLWTIQLFKPIVNFIIKCRYLPFSCVVFIFTASTDTVESLKTILLLFGLVPYLTTSFVAIITDVIDKGTELNKSYVNKRGKWETLWEVIVVGKSDQLFEVIRQNFAFGWTMLTAVEAKAIGSGGLGTMIIKSEHHVLLAEIFAVALIILSFGITCDYILRTIRMAYPYMKKSKR
jgi:NitT/TauT family transport system permease protein